MLGDKVICLVFVLILTTGLSVADSCAYGDGCRFPCQCNSGVGCDPVTGECEDGQCRSVPPYGYNFGWSDAGCRGGNIAYSKETSQSGEWRGHSSEKAVDGDTNPVIEAGKCAHPYLDDVSSQAWWRVDLGKTHIIEEIVIFNRDAKKDRTNDFFIRIGDYEDIDAQPVCVDYTAGEQDILTLSSFTCPNPEGRYVSMKRKLGSLEQNEINICEFVVIGYEPMVCYDNCNGTCDSLTGCEICHAGRQLPDCIDECNDISWGANCVYSCGACLSYLPCNKVTGVCDDGCLDDWYVNNRCDVYLDVPSLGDKIVLVAEISPYSLNVTWEQMSIQEGLHEHYFYTVVYNSLESTRINHDSNTQFLSYTIHELEYNTVYSITVLPYRILRDQEEPGEPAHGVYTKTPCIAPSKPSLNVQTTSETWILLVGDLEDIITGCDKITNYDLYVTDGPNVLYSTSVLDIELVSLPFEKSFNGSQTWVVAMNNENMETRSETELLFFSRPATPNPPSMDENTALIVGCVIGILGAVALIISLVLTYRIKRSQPQKDSAHNVNSENFATEHSAKQGATYGYENTQSTTTDSDGTTAVYEEIDDQLKQTFYYNLNGKNYPKTVLDKTHTITNETDSFNNEIRSKKNEANYEILVSSEPGQAVANHYQSLK